MEKKKLKLSVSASSKKAFNSIEEAKSKSKNTVVIEKKIQNILVNLNFLDKIMIVLNQLKQRIQSLAILPDHQRLQLQTLKREN